MTIIIDTHIFLWALAEPERLSSSQQMALLTRANTIYLSAVSIAEMMIKSSLGKLEIPFDPKEMAEATGFDILDYRGEDALLLKILPFHHRDLFDRMIITQSLAHGYPIMTVDSKFSLYSCKLF
jgi:PIN domain nuclease of toxin-antitoxin system